LAAVRTAEMEQALAVLGITEHQWLDYPDGHCVDVPDHQAVSVLTRIMQGVRPDTVLTFGPDGMTGHPDHISVSRWTTAAHAESASNAVLAYATNTPEWLEQYRPGMDKVGAFMGSEPPCTPVDELVIHQVFEGDLLAAKLTALRCQVSQVEPLVAALGEDFLRNGLAEESFRAP
jgi:LmbE family N-acetylglucosaminyl deacetylase